MRMPFISTNFISKCWNATERELSGAPLTDTVDLPPWDGKNTVYPSVKLRMDFRNPAIVGTFVYHCHILEHEDGGMMGVIRVLPAR